MDSRSIILGFGDPDKICKFENHVLLKLEKPWKEPASSLPKGMSLDVRRLCITATVDSFVEHWGLFDQNGRKVAALLFASCPSFESSLLLRAASSNLVSSAVVRTLVVVHNRDTVRNLLDWFRPLHVLVLHHDLRVQDGDGSRWREIGGEGPQLQKLMGSTPALGMHNLALSTETICGLLRDCVHLYNLQTSLHDFASPAADPRVSAVLATARSLPVSRRVALGCTVERLDGSAMAHWNITPGHMDQAAKLFPYLSHLEVTTSHKETIAKIALFKNLIAVSLTFITRDGLCPFRGLLEQTLKELKLECLSLRFIEGVSLNTIAHSWPRLQSLSLSECTIEDESFVAGMFAGLVNLRLGLGVSFRSLELLVNAARRLVTLRLDGDQLCTAFVGWCSLASLESLERLYLGTEKALKALALTAEDLQSLVKALPSLRFVSTNSYDLRLFFDNYMPRVTTEWCQCATCAAHFPLISKSQRDIWMKVVVPPRRKAL